MEYWERKENGKVLEIKKTYDSRNDNDLFRLELESQAENMQLVFENYEERLNQEINRINELISNESDSIKLNKNKLIRETYCEMLRIFKYEKAQQGVAHVSKPRAVVREVEKREPRVEERKFSPSSSFVGDSIINS